MKTIISNIFILTVCFLSSVGLDAQQHRPSRFFESNYPFNSIESQQDSSGFFPIRSVSTTPQTPVGFSPIEEEDEELDDASSSSVALLSSEVSNCSICRRHVGWVSPIQEVDESRTVTPSDKMLGDGFLTIVNSTKYSIILHKESLIKSQSCSFDIDEDSLEIINFGSICPGDKLKIQICEDYFYALDPEIYFSLAKGLNLIQILFDKEASRFKPCYKSVNSYTREILPVQKEDNFFSITNELDVPIEFLFNDTCVLIKPGEVKIFNYTEATEALIKIKELTRLAMWPEPMLLLIPQYRSRLRVVLKHCLQGDGQRYVVENINYNQVIAEMKKFR